MSANYGVVDALRSFAEGAVGDTKTEALVLAVAVGYATRFTNIESVLAFLAKSGEPTPTDRLQVVLQGYFSRLDARLAACAVAVGAASDAAGGFEASSALVPRTVPALYSPNVELCAYLQTVASAPDTAADDARNAALVLTTLRATPVRVASAAAANDVLIRERQGVLRPNVAKWIHEWSSAQLSWVAGVGEGSSAPPATALLDVLTGHTERGGGVHVGARNVAVWDPEMAADWKRRALDPVHRAFSGRGAGKNINIGAWVVYVDVVAMLRGAATRDLTLLTVKEKCTRAVAQRLWPPTEEEWLDVVLAMRKLKKGQRHVEDCCHRLGGIGSELAGGESFSWDNSITAA